MPKMKVNLGTKDSPIWIKMDASDADTLDGMHYTDIKTDYQQQLTVLQKKMQDEIGNIKETLENTGTGAKTLVEYIQIENNQLKSEITDLDTRVEDDIRDLNTRIDNVKGYAVVGTANFNSAVGVKIPHNIGSTNYFVFITPSQDSDGYLGEYYTIKQSDSFTVYNSGSATTKFDYVAFTY